MAERRSGKDRRVLMAAGHGTRWSGAADRRKGSPDRRNDGRDKRREASDYWVGPNDRRHTL